LLFDTADAEELAHALHHVLSDPTARVGLVERGLARAAQFTWDRCASQTLAVLSEAARG
jgi:glycosyltransferase involved in cell wall biosynthesis